MYLQASSEFYYGTFFYKIWIVQQPAVFSVHEIKIQSPGAKEREACKSIASDTYVQQSENTNLVAIEATQAQR